MGVGTTAKGDVETLPTWEGRQHMHATLRALAKPAMEAVNGERMEAGALKTGGACGRALFWRRPRRGRS